VSIEDDERLGRSSTSKTAENVEKIRDLIHEDRRRIAAKFVPRLLTNDQKHRRVNVS
jgi:hypothetical protein